MMGYSLDFGAVLTGEHLRWMLNGLLVTVELSIASWLLALGIAVILVLLRNSSFRSGEWFVALYVETHQNIPLLVQVLFCYFAVPELLPENARIWLNERNSEF